MQGEGETRFHDAGEVVVTSRPLPVRKESRFVDKADLGALLRLGLYSAGIRMLPEARWAGFCRAIPQKRGRSARRRMEMGLRAFFGEGKTEAEIETISSDFRRGLARRLMLTASEANPHWAPALDLHDGHRIRQALDRGKGVILWCDAFTSQSLIGKRMLHEHGYRGSQVSLYEHGYSTSWLGRRLINTIQQKQELRHAERLDFDRGQAPGVVRRVQRVLRSGGLVMISNNIATATSVAEMPFGDAGRLVVAIGPARIAASCQAALLPYAVVEEEPFRRYLGFVGDDLLGAGTPENAGSMERSNGAVLAYRRWIEPLVSGYPAQWMRWASVAPRGEPEE